MLIDGAVGKFMTAAGRYGHVNTMVKNIKTKKEFADANSFCFKLPRILYRQTPPKRKPYR